MLSNFKISILIKLRIQNKNTNPASSNLDKNLENFKINQTQHALKYKNTIQEHKQNISFNKINPN